LTFAAALLVIFLLLAMASYHIFEERFLRLKRYFPPDMSLRSQQADATSLEVVLVMFGDPSLRGAEGDATLYLGRSPQPMGIGPSFPAECPP
jgi:hypothetical protein